MSEILKSRINKIKDAQRVKAEADKGLTTAFIHGWYEAREIVRSAFQAAEEAFGEPSLSSQEVVDRDIWLQYIAKKSAPKYELRYHPDFSKREVTLTSSAPSGGESRSIPLADISASLVEDQIYSFLNKVCVT